MQYGGSQYGGAQPPPPPPPQQQGGGGNTVALQQLAGNNFVIKQKKLSLGNKYYLEDGSGRPVGFVHQKLMKLKEDIRIYTDESMRTEMMKIKQEQILDFSGSFQVMDSQSGELVGILKRKGLKSMFKDEWLILDRNRSGNDKRTRWLQMVHQTVRDQKPTIRI